jgi:choline kinase
MKAIILAAGEGKRLRPLTSSTPKCLVKIWGKSMLERQLEQLLNLGIDDITVVTGYCKEKIEKLNINTVFNAEFDSSNMVFSLSKVLPELNLSDAEQTLILYGDIAYGDEQLSALIDNSSRSPMTILGNTKWLELWSQRLEEPLLDAETFQYDDNLILQEIGKVPSSLEQVQAQYMGMIKVNTQYLIMLLQNYLKNAHDSVSKNMYMTDLIQQVVNSDSVNVVLVAGKWIEVDTFEDYELYQNKQAADFGLTR